MGLDYIGQWVVGQFIQGALNFVYEDFGVLFVFPPSKLLYMSELLQQVPVHVFNEALIFWTTGGPCKSVNVVRISYSSSTTHFEMPLRSCNVCILLPSDSHLTTDHAGRKVILTTREPSILAILFTLKARTKMKKRDWTVEEHKRKRSIWRK